MRALVSGTLIATMFLAIVAFESPDNIRALIPKPIKSSDFYWDGTPDEAMVELGRMLFFDKVLSGNRNISCATCHHPNHATADAVALPFGEGAIGLGAARMPGELPEESVHERVPRNSPALFNLGAREFVRMFHDGRVEVDSFGYYDGGFITPAKWKLPAGLVNVLAAQAMFPVTSPAEMAGQRYENSLAEAKALNNLAGPGGLWEQVGERLQEIPEYVDMFKRAYPEFVDSAHDINMVLAANAISAFETVAFRSDNSPYDEYIRTGHGLDEASLRGMRLFYGKANCSSCHSGKFQTDHDFHAIGMPQLGPGKAHGRDASYWRETGINAFVEDFGRGRVTYRPEDDFKFRTPSLRNIELTAPYGHSGAFQTLEEIVRHHIDPVKSLDQYEVPSGLLQPIETVYETTADDADLRHRPMSDERKAAFLQRDTWVQDNIELRARIAAANELEPIDLTQDEIGDLVAFMKSLTDPSARDLSHVIPDRVPSGLEIDR